MQESKQEVAFLVKEKWWKTLPSASIHGNIYHCRLIQQTTNWWSFSYFSLKIGYDILCKLSPLETICIRCMSNPVFWKKNCVVCWKLFPGLLCIKQLIHKIFTHFQALCWRLQRLHCLRHQGHLQGQEWEPLQVSSISGSAIFAFFNILHCFQRSFSSHITKKKCLYNVDPLKTHFYILKQWFTGLYIIFLISSLKHSL